MTKPIKQYKFLRTGMKSENGIQKWRKGKWVKVDGKLDMCENGFHSSVEPYDAFTYVQGEILAVVECRGKNLNDKNKYCWEEQRVIKTYKWTKKDSVRLVIFSAELCLKNYENKYPNDPRTRQAIEAAKKVLSKDTKKNRDAAESAGYAAWSAVGYAGYAAGYAAEYAAGYAARSAEYAAGYAAWYTAWSVGSVGSAAVKKIQTYFKKLVKGLKEI